MSFNITWNRKISETRARKLNPVLIKSRVDKYDSDSTYEASLSFYSDPNAILRLASTHNCIGPLEDIQFPLYIWMDRS